MYLLGEMNSPYSPKRRKRKVLCFPGCHIWTKAIYKVPRQPAIHLSIYLSVLFACTDANSFFLGALEILSDRELIHSSQISSFPFRLSKWVAAASYLTSPLCFPNCYLGRREGKEENDNFLWHISFVGPCLCVLWLAAAAVASSARQCWSAAGTCLAIST